MQSKARLAAHVCIELTRAQPLGPTGTAKFCQLVACHLGINMMTSLLLQVIHCINLRSYVLTVLRSYSYGLTVSYRPINMQQCHCDDSVSSILTNKKSNTNTLFSRLSKCCVNRCRQLRKILGCDLLLDNICRHTGQFRQLGLHA